MDFKTEVFLMTYKKLFSRCRDLVKKSIESKYTLNVNSPSATNGQDSQQGDICGEYGNTPPKDGEKSP